MTKRPAQLERPESGQLRLFDAAYFVAGPARPPPRKDARSTAPQTLRLGFDDESKAELAKLRAAKGARQARRHLRATLAEEPTGLDVRPEPTQASEPEDEKVLLFPRSVPLAQRQRVLRELAARLGRTVGGRATRLDFREGADRLVVAIDGGVLRCLLLGPGAVARWAAVVEAALEEAGIPLAA